MMEHWSNINATYGRLSSASGIPANASGLSPFDLHVMDQRSFGSAGLSGGLANPLPAHAAPLTPARLTSMTHPVSYGTLHGSMNPLFEGFPTSGFSNQSSYRPAMGQAALYSLEAVSGSHVDTMSRLASVISSQPPRSSSSSSSALFNTDSHMMNDSSIQGLASASDAAVAAADFWSRSGFMPTAAGVGPFLGMQPSSAGNVKKDPPPAHSGSRPTPVASSKSRCYHETQSIAQQTKPDYAMSQTSRAPMASSPPTAHANSQRFEAQRFFPGRTSQTMTPAVTAEQRYSSCSSLQMDLNDVMSSDDTSGSIIGGQGTSFGGCSPTTFPSSGFPVSEKPRTMFQPQVQLAVTDSRAQATSYGSLVASTNPMLTAYNEYGMSKGYAAGAMAARVIGPASGVLCGRNSDRDDSFGLGGLLGCSSAAAQASVASILTVQAVADSTTKPKKSAVRTGRSPKAARTSRPQGFDGGYSAEEDLMTDGLGASDGRRGRPSKIRKSSDGRDQFESSGKEMMDGGSTDRVIYENVDRYMPQLMAAPGGGGVSALSSAMFSHGISSDVHLSGALLQGSDIYSYGQNKPNQEAQVFLTNLCGSSFVNPNELLLKENVVENFAGIQEHAAYADATNNYDLAMKQRNDPPAPPPVIDEEFTHLAQAPVIDSEPSKCATTAKPAKTEVATPNKGNFLDSFVNFLSGKKPETLSSVSSTAAANRPILPKYIPDTRPRRTDEDVKKSAECPGKEKQSTSPDVKMVHKLTPGVVVGVKILDSAAAAVKSAVKSAEHVKKSTMVPRPVVPALVVPAREQSVAAPVRPQPMRKAKTVVEEKRKHKINSDDSSDEEDVKKTTSVVRSRREARNDDSDYDSDKDPAWKPAQSNRKRSHHEDDELESPAKKIRGRKPSVKSESVREVVSWASPVVEPMSIKAASLPEKARSSAVHAYQKGDFVIEKKDLKSATYSIWKIDTGRLLQKYEPAVRDGRRVHQAISTYSSWSDDIKVNYVAIQINVVVSSRAQEVVEVIEDFRPNDSNSAESFVEPFSVFIQILLSQSLEPNFLDALLHDPEPYYMDPLGTIEAAIQAHLDRIKADCKWTKEFVEDVDSMSQVQINDGTFDSLTCQATEGSSVAATASVKLFGKVYVRSNMKTVKEVMESEAKELLVGAPTRQCLPVYHGLCHLKLTLYELCQKKVMELKQDSELEDHQVLDTCLQDPIWLKELFKMLEELFKEASSTVVV